MLNFIKFSVTGNDFIVIDNRMGKYSASNRYLWNKLCRRKFGIGADGVLLLEKSDKADFKMRYINADGMEVSMCGNGARAITYFAHFVLKLKSDDPTYYLEALNENYLVYVDRQNITIEMRELYDIGKINLDGFGPFENSLYLNTGVPHCVFQVKDVDKINVMELGKKISHDKIFSEGTNVNFFQVLADNKLKIRTYERGVEEETCSCGTGAVACAVASSKFFNWKETVEISTEGGKLMINYDESLKKIQLSGKVEIIFEGGIKI